MWFCRISKTLLAEAAVLLKTIFLSAEDIWQIKHLVQKHTGRPLKPDHSMNDMQPSIFF